VNAFAAMQKYGTPCIVCSFGTATTVDVVNAGNELLGGIIAPA
jgi:type III pantothenate kinase